MKPRREASTRFLVLSAEIKAYFLPGAQRETASSKEVE